MLIMKNILFPTDFTPQSLGVLEQYIKGASGSRITIILFASFEMPASEQEVVGAGNKPHLQVMNEEFRKGCKKLKEKYAGLIGNIFFKYMYGNTRQVFRNYLDFNEIDQIFFPEGFQLMQPHPRFLDPSSLINNAGIPVIRELPTVANSRPKQAAGLKTELSASY
ncbi:MAG: hypothetical protein A1D16_20835 [Flavihumibacter sp. CACIAM 22H1]|nr:MAG: hypothetical protein A1D16_20835 [Flavihumibacter sp. CACIAM 22H1]